MIDYPKTLEEARAYIYGQSVYNLSGDRYIEGTCAYEIWRGMWYRQCRRKNGHGPAGLYCWQHAKKITMKLKVYTVLDGKLKVEMLDRFTVIGLMAVHETLFSERENNFTVTLIKTGQCITSELTRNQAKELAKLLQENFEFWKYIKFKKGKPGKLTRKAQEQYELYKNETRRFICLRRCNYILDRD